MEKWESQAYGIIIHPFLKDLGLLTSRLKKYISKLHREAINWMLSSEISGENTGAITEFHSQGKLCSKSSKANTLMSYYYILSFLAETKKHIQIPAFYFTIKLLHTLILTSHVFAPLKVILFEGRTKKQLLLDDPYSIHTCHSRQHLQFLIFR